MSIELLGKCRFFDYKKLLANKLKTFIKLALFHHNKDLCSKKF